MSYLKSRLKYGLFLIFFTYDENKPESWLREALTVRKKITIQERTRIRSAEVILMFVS